MLTQEMYVYIAAPFFNEAQLAVVERIEKILEANDIKYFSPRKDGVLIEMEKAERDKKMEAIFQSNIQHLEDCNCMIAIIDDYDTGTVFELGYWTALRYEREQIAITVSANDYTLNVMLKYAVNCHTQSIDDLYRLILGIKMDGGPNEMNLAKWNNFPENIT